MYVFYYELTQKDFLTFFAYNSAKSKSRKSVQRYMVFFLTVLIFIVAVTATHSAESRPWFAIVLITVIFAVVTNVFIWLTVKPLTALILKLNFKMMKKDGKLPFGFPTTLTFENDYILDASERAETKLFYPTVVKIAESPDAIYVYINAIEALVLPHRVFESGEQKQELLRFLRGKVCTTEE
jgi:hypothetical protein